MQISNDEVSRLLAFLPTERGANRQAVVTADSPHTEAAQASEAAQVELSPVAYDIQRTKRLVQDLPDVREERVRALKAQIDSGTYHVSGEDIADLIIRRTLADNAGL